MQLSLRPAAGPLRPACAAFLRGADAGAWLRELGRWLIAPADVVCYVVPESVRSRQPAGLLVVRRAGEVPADCLEPYGIVAGRLLVPVNAELWPATTPEELAATLLWPRQLLHPSIGLVGFSGEDEISLEALLTLPTPHATAWNLARPGSPPPPRLRAVRVTQPPANELLSHLRDTIGSQPLSNIPKPDEATTPTQRLLDSLGRGALKVGLSLTKGLAGALGGVGAGLGAGLGAALGAFGGIGSGSSGGAPGSPAGPGPLEQLQNWLQHNLDGLEQKRQNEVERLLRMFGEDMELALQYAIPLGGPYLNRGVAPPSAYLGPRSTRFNLSQLGGGTRVDSWDVGNYEQQLRQQYRQAAEQARQAGRHEQAAYIYAHLLADYHQAAKVLEQGQYYREAAALYRDHLGNLPGAAECLERGGLLLEAAELRAQLLHHEKAGDLYQQLQQPETAAVHYERAAATFLEAHNHPEAARLLHRKLDSPTRAQDALLTGWLQNRQAETCLQHYLAVAATRPEVDLSTEIRMLYRQHTRPAQHGAFLQVLVSVQQTAPEVQPVARELAYHIISTEAQAGQPKHLSLLHHFQPTDRLLATDASRYLTTARTRPVAAPTTAPPASEHQLDARISWYQAVAHRNQFLALGLLDNRLHLARSNWYGHVEYFSWPDELSDDVRPRMFLDAFHSTNVVLHGHDGLATQYLAKSKHFDEALLVVCPRLPADPIGIGLLPNEELVVLRQDGEGIQAQYFSIHGVPGKEWVCKESQGISLDLNRYEVAPVFHREDSYYSYWDDNVFRVGKETIVVLEVLPNPVEQLLCGPTTELFVRAGDEITVFENWNDESSSSKMSDVSDVHEMSLVGAGRLALASTVHAIVYTHDDNEEQLFHSYQTETPIVAILSTNNRRQFALLEANGRLTRCAIPAE
ncbi:hypothetical protein [Hymenobacter sp. UYP22]|uniref:hypothetical protein n=1 Tax=Hymenobacter sp. UYP22 TaxID=3156348 RepID=UPI003393CC5D